MFGNHNDAFGESSLDNLDGPLTAEPLHQINWNLLNAHDAEAEWIERNRWVNWLQRTYGLPATVVPPFWHRHPELVWELSALHLHRPGAYDPDQHGSAPLGWHRDYADARKQLRDWVATQGYAWNATGLLARLSGQENRPQTQSKTSS